MDSTHAEVSGWPIWLTSVSLGCSADMSECRWQAPIEIGELDIFDLGAFERGLALVIRRSSVGGETRAFLEDGDKVTMRAFAGAGPDRVVPGEQ